MLGAKQRSVAIFETLLIKVSGEGNIWSVIGLGWVWEVEKLEILLFKAVAIFQSLPAELMSFGMVVQR